MRSAIPGLAITLVIVAIAQAQTPLPIGGEFQVNTYTTYEQGRPAIAMTPGGDFIVVWKSLEQDGDRDGVLAQHFNSDVSRSGTEFRVNTTTCSAQLAPGVAAVNGEFIVTWEGQGPGDSWGILGQRFLAGVTFLGGFESGDTAAWSGAVQ